jgi:hypothetical protein
VLRLKEKQPDAADDSGILPEIQRLQVWAKPHIENGDDFEDWFKALPSQEPWTMVKVLSSSLARGQSTVPFGRR